MYATIQARKMLSGAAMTLLLASTPALAAPSDTVPTVTVSYAELDISRLPGAQVLYGRIEQAALQVCPVFAGPYREMLTRKSACYQHAIAKAVADVNSPQLFAIYRARATRLASN